jgi:hypothetical protein
MARDLAAINQDVSRLREQAKALHDAGDASRRQVMAEVNNQHQAARRDESAHQAAADRAESQIAAEQADLADYEKKIADLKTQADAEKDPAKAEELREEVNHTQASADAVKDTIANTQQAADEARAAVEVAKAEQTRLEASMKEQAKPALGMEEAADQIDQKARYLDEAAKLERQATVAEMDGDKVTAQEQRQLADDALMRANRIQPDVSNIDPQVLQTAGIDPDALKVEQEYTKDDTDSTGIDDPAPAATDANATTTGDANAAAATGDANAAAATDATATGTSAADALDDDGSGNGTAAATADGTAADSLDADTMSASATPTNVDLLGTDSQPSDITADGGDLTAPPATADQGSDLDTGTVNSPDLDTPPPDVSFDTPPDDTPAEPDVDTMPAYDSGDSGDTQSYESPPDADQPADAAPEADMVDGG